MADDQKEWEEVQAKAAALKFGSKNKAKARRDYDYVFEDHIDFIKDEIMKGNVPEAEPEFEKEDKGEDIQATRKALPIFVYREELVQAVKDHQVLIIVGETGSGKVVMLHTR